jgi:hypothetical protein
MPTTRALPRVGRYLRSGQSCSLLSRPTFCIPAHLEPAKSAGTQPEMADAGSAFRISIVWGHPHRIKHLPLTKPARKHTSLIA